MLLVIAEAKTIPSVADVCDRLAFSSQSNHEDKVRQQHAVKLGTMLQDAAEATKLGKNLRC